MGLIMEEKTNKKIENGNNVIFTLLASTDDFHPDNEEGAYTCNIHIFDENDKVCDEFYRLFPVQSFNERHYKAFIRKFVRDKVYREQFNIHLGTEEHRPNGFIDFELQEIIMQLNDLGLRTKYCCQGTKDPWSDRPFHSDGHSVTSYIIFDKHLPTNFSVVARQYPSLYVGFKEIRTKRRNDNIYHDKK